MVSWKFEQPSPVLQTESQKLLLRLLSHPLLHVRVETYACTLSLVKVSVSWCAVHGWNYSRESHKTGLQGNM